MPRHAASFLVLALAATAFAPPAAQAENPNPSFNLVNKGDAPVRQIFATPAGNENWGRSRLESREVAPGASYPVRLRADGNCLFDIRVVYGDGRTEDHRRVETCRAVSVIVGQGDVAGTAQPATAAVGSSNSEPAFRLINRGSSAITEFYATPANADRPGENMLRDGEKLAPQDSKRFRLSANEGCSYDLRVVFANHQSRQKKATDLCKISDLPVQ